MVLGKIFRRKKFDDDEWVDKEIEATEAGNGAADGDDDDTRFEYSNGRRKKLYRNLALGLTAAATLCGWRACTNLWEMHKWDKYVIKPIEIAANVASAGSEEGKKAVLSMETTLIEAMENVDVSSLANPAIIWETPYTEVAVLEDILGKAVKRSQEIQQFKTCFETGKVKEDSPKWVRDAYSKLRVSDKVENLDLLVSGKIDPLVETLKRTSMEPEQEEMISGLIQITRELTSTAKGLAATVGENAESEYGQRIGSEYEALNTVVAGGTRAKGKNYAEKHRSLLDTLEKAGGWRSIIRWQADDFKQAYAHVFVGYLKANMGYLTNGLKDFEKAKRLMDKYPDDKNLAIWRNTKEMEQSTIKGLIDSGIREWKTLDNDPSRYSTGWWKRLRYFNRSIGGQTDPSIQDMAEAINDRYWRRAEWLGILFLGFAYFGGKLAKRYRKAKEYEVLHETFEPDQGTGEE